MNRKYNCSQFLDKINLIRSYFENVNITTDYMAGFSGETDLDFEASLKFIEKVGFGEMHIFPYSRRPRTKAYNFDGIVNPIVKKERVNKLLELNKQKALEYRNNFLHKEVEVLVEKEIDGLLFGHTSNYLEVLFSGNCQINEYARVMIKDVDYPICKGVEIL